MKLNKVMVTLCDDILADILVRLPAKSIGRFRCVNKPWCKLLKDRDFVQRHLARATEFENFSFMLSSHVDAIPDISYDDMISTISYDPLSSTCGDLVKINCPLRPKSAIEFFGYCNGLVCLSTYTRDVIVLWNPTTQEYKRLPIPRLQTNYCYIRHIEYGFGYDGKIDDFKVVIVASFRHVYASEVQIYTLKSDSWRYLKKYPYNLDYHSDDTSDIQRVTINGALYWLAFTEGVETEIQDDDDGEIIIYFDFEKEIFDHISLPSFFFEPYSEAYSQCKTRLCVLRESLCLIRFSPEVGVNVWELDDCRAKGQSAWTKIFTLELQKHFGAGVTNLMPLRSLENGKILVGFDKADGTFHIVLYDQKDETTKTICQVTRNKNAKSWSIYTSVYVESLVSLNSGTFSLQGPMEYEDSSGPYYDKDEIFKMFNSDKEEEQDEDGDVVSKGKGGKSRLFLPCFNLIMCDY